MSSAETRTAAVAAQRPSHKVSKEMTMVKKRVCVMIVIGIICVSIGIASRIYWPPFFEDALKKQLVLSPTSMSYSLWKETPIPMYLKIYLFNWTNADEISTPNVKPHFEQMGPYVFREIDTKMNSVWNNNNGTITFQQRRVWYFEPTMSNGTLQDHVTNLNPIAATIGYIVKDAGIVKTTIVNGLLKKLEKKIAITKTIKEILFDGYDDILLKLAEDFDFTDIPFKRFAWFYGRNGSETYDGSFNMMTGATGLYDIGILKEWNYQNHSPKYPKSCGELKGTIGDLWPPLMDNETLSVFSPDVCASLSLKYSGETNLFGLSGSKYISDADMFDNGTRVESRKCYCQGVECQPSGSFNVSACKFGAPAFVSSPHFYLADPSYTQSITGMNPKKEDHEFILVIQPDTGVPIRVRAALQLNFLVEPYKKLSFFENLPKMYVPMLWFAQEANLSPELAKQIKILTLIPPIVNGTLYFIIGVGLLLYVLSGVMYFRQRSRDEQNQNLIPRETHSRNKDTEENATNVSSDE